MLALLQNYGYGKSWTQYSADRCSGYLPNMSDYHMHEYYEISLILSGDVSILLPKSVRSGIGAFLMLVPPMTPHMVTCRPPLLYERVNLNFSDSFLADFTSEWKLLLGVFGSKGNIISLSPAQAERYHLLFTEMETDSDSFRWRLRLLLLLSQVSEQTAALESSSATPPAYVTEALNYLQANFAEKITASELADRLHVGRTTLLTNFKRCTGTTLNTYLTRWRLKQALQLLRQGLSQQETAEYCGFGEPSNLIRCFHRYFGTSPGKYLRSIR